MGCYICGAKSSNSCNHCYKPICKEHSYFIESISAYLCESCYSSFVNGSQNVISE
ncbi:MAG: hypothetical protein H5T44_04310 [Thermoplasmatales archaeon]|nr:hypothetical protein [Thermoplasmatales archaeon]